MVQKREVARDGRFIAYDDGTVLDTKTGLMWAAKDNGADIDWQGAREYCENYPGGGYQDWRMPTQAELGGIYDPSKPYVSEAGFDVFLPALIRHTGAWVWASETSATDAAYFDFYLGAFRRTRPSNNNAGRAFPVRTARTFRPRAVSFIKFSWKWIKSKVYDFRSITSINNLISRFRRLFCYFKLKAYMRVNKDGTVSDPRTGLMWGCSDNGRDIDWFDAEENCRNYHGGEFTDWRLPTLAELESLYSAGVREGMIKPIGITGRDYWSSEARPNAAGFFDFRYGNQESGDKIRTGDHRVIPVRTS